MGLMKRLFGGGNGNLANGADLSGHSIDKSKALAHTDSNVVSPHNANFSSVRSMPIVEKPRHFTVNEANVLVAVAKEKQITADQAVIAYDALERIERSDAKVHNRHRKYQGTVAKEELSKLEANAHLAAQLHGMRPKYEQIGQKVETAERKADNAIRSIRASYGA